MLVTDCDTPELVLDIEAVERNIKRMSEYFRGKKASLRVHTKIHKSPFIAHMQIAAGSRGITCAKLGEAEIMMESGIKDILIANEITSEQKIDKMARMARYCDLKVAVDSVENAAKISTAVNRIGSTIGILVDINMGGTTNLNGILDRCGVAPGQDALNLVEKVHKLPGLKFRGLMGYEGSIFNYQSSKEIDAETRVTLCKKALGILMETKDLIEDAGIDVEIVSGGGTMTYNIAADFPGMTEVQAGMYALMDTTYRRYGMDFEFGVCVLSRVISHNRSEKIILDAGGTAISIDSGLPWIRDKTDLKVTEVNAEHTHVSVLNSSDAPKVGDCLKLLPSNVDTLTCLHDRYVVERREEVEMILDIPIRGKFQ